MSVPSALSEFPSNFNQTLLGQAVGQGNANAVEFLLSLRTINVHEGVSSILREILTLLLIEYEQSLMPGDWTS
jgi:hypothetical protein